MARVESRAFSFEELVEQVRAGRLRCPRFQRSFVWRADQVLDFFDSVRLRYPVGSLLIWRTTERWASFDRVGPIPVPDNQPQAPAEVGYVLDGHQRMSVIFGVLALTDDLAAQLRGQDRVFLVHYDLEAQTFVYPRYAAAHQLPVRYLFGADDRLTSWVDERRDQTEAGSQERKRWDEYRRRANHLQTIFAQYRLPYLDITDATLEEAVNIFCRVNSQGTPVRRGEVFAALSWKPDGFDFAAEAKLLLDQHPRYTNFGTEPVLRSLLAALGESVYDSDWEAVLKEHTSKLADTMDVIREGFGKALEFLGGEFGAASGRVVPYSLHIVMLTELFRLDPNPPERTRQELRRWLWATSFAAAYTSASTVDVSRALTRIRKLAGGEQVSLVPEHLQLRPFSRRFHPKAARVRAFHLFLKAQSPRDLDTGEVLPASELLINGMTDARPVATGGDRAWRLASRLLVGAGRRRLEPQLQQLAQGRLDVDVDAILRSHLIPRDALEAFVCGDVDLFLELRERELIRAERAFAAEYVDVEGVEETEEEAEIDVDEDP